MDARPARDGRRVILLAFENREVGRPRRVTLERGDDAVAGEDQAVGGAAGGVRLPALEFLFRPRLVVRLVERQRPEFQTPRHPVLVVQREQQAEVAHLKEIVGRPRLCAGLLLEPLRPALPAPNVVERGVSAIDPRLAERRDVLRRRPLPRRRGFQDLVDLLRLQPARVRRLGRALVSRRPAETGSAHLRLDAVAVEGGLGGPRAEGVPDGLIGRQRLARSAMEYVSRWTLRMPQPLGAALRTGAPGETLAETVASGRHALRHRTSQSDQVSRAGREV